jgi:hypothetical protein
MTPLDCCVSCMPADARADLEAGASLRGDAVPYRLADRVRKALWKHYRASGTRSADYWPELYETLTSAKVTRTRPEWIAPDGRKVDAWLLVSESVVCPMGWDERGELRARAVLVRR